MNKRVFLIVLDSLGVGGSKDAYLYGDEGSNTLSAIQNSKYFNAPNLTKMGLFNISGNDRAVENPTASYGALNEQSVGKDTTTGHWEIAGLISKTAFPTYPNGFPSDIISEFERLCGRGVLCNKPYSGTEVIKDYGKAHIESGKLIVYTSADSVFQIAAHEDIVPVKELYRYCEIARKLLVGKHNVGRVIARPFTGEYPFTRTANRHDFSVEPSGVTMLDILKNGGLSVISIGKINDIFAGVGVTESYPTKSNQDGMQKTYQMAKRQFNGLCFVNLVDFDSVYGHRNDIDGYANAISEFDTWLKDFVCLLDKEDMLIITADHGCDPSTPSTDHSRERVPLIVYGSNLKCGVNLGERDTFADISATVLQFLGQNQGKTAGKSFLKEVQNV